MEKFLKNKVLIYAHHAPPHPSACATRMLSLANHLRLQDIEVVFLTTKEGPKVHDGFSIERYSGRLALFQSLIKHTSCPILISSPPGTPSAEVAILTRILGYRVIVDIRDPFVSEALKNGELSRGLKTWLKLTLEWSLFRTAHAVSYVSTPLRLLMEAHFGNPNCPYVIAPNGIDTNTFNLDTRPLLERRELLEIGDEPLFIYVGILGGKSLDEAISALAPALNTGALLLMIVVVDEYSSPIQKSLAEKAESLGVNERIIWRFNLSQLSVNAHLAASDFGLNPLPFNRDYCLPVKTFEFLACGVYPVNIVSEKSALRSAVQNDAVTSFCDSWESFSELTVKLTKNVEYIRTQREVRAQYARLNHDRKHANDILAGTLLENE